MLLFFLRQCFEMNGSMEILFKNGWIRVLICLLVFLPSACIEEEDIDLEEVVKVGDMLPNFTVTMNDGRVVTSDSLRNTASVVMFFHTTCPDCQQALPRVQRLYDKFSSEGVSFVLISREEEAASIAAFWKANGLTLPYSPQSDRRVYELFAHRRVPCIYVSDRQGVVRYVFTDNPLPAFEEMSEILQDML
jgi:peroxiredoxin